MQGKPQKTQKAQKAQAVKKTQTGKAAQAAKKRQNTASPLLQSPVWKWIVPGILGVVYFLLVSLSSPSTIKPMAILAVLLLFGLGSFYFVRLRDRFGVLLLALALYVVMDGVSTFYSVSGKFALYEFLKVLIAFCLSLVLLVISPKEEAFRGHQTALILAVCAAMAGLTSIDLISTRWLSGMVTGLLGLFSQDYAELAGIEEGVRMTSLYTNPNVFAGIAGIGVLLSLGLADVAGERKERAFSTVLLYINALAFLLAFSMGASAFIVPGFLVLLLLEPRERRAGLLILMLETLVLTVAAAALVSMTSFRLWSGFQPVPMLCAVCGSAALCLLDRFVGRRLSVKLDAHRKIIPVTIGALVVLMGVYAVAAWNLTGAATLSPGETLRRAAYPEPGSYSLDVQADHPIHLTIESQNRQETMMHTSTILYEGDGADAAFTVFTVPDGSLVTYFNFSAPEGGQIASADYAGEAGSGSVPLGYKLLPGFVATRLQGLFANENAIQRLVFFEDGMKLFRRSPVVGLGMGAFENGIKSVQSFYYETKYAHDHYIQLLVETGVIGLILFLCLLVLSAVAVWRARGSEALAPALGAALVFMAGHAFTEVVFSAYAYLPMAFGVFLLIHQCCSDRLPFPALGAKLKTGLLAGLAGLIAVYAVLLGCNMYATDLVERKGTLDSLNTAAKIDKFEWADYAFSYVIYAIDGTADGSVRRQADAYAARLERADSNTTPLYLARYYFAYGRTDKAFAMLEKYLDYVSSDSAAWQSAFDLLQTYETKDSDFRDSTRRIIAQLDDWNQDNMGTIELNEEALAFIQRMR